MLLIEYVCFGCDKHCTCLIQPIPLRPEGCILNRLEYMHELLDHILNLQEWLAIGRGTAKIYDKRLLKNIRAWLYLYFSARDRYGQ